MNYLLIAISSIILLYTSAFSYKEGDFKTFISQNETSDGKFEYTIVVVNNSQDLYITDFTIGVSKYSNASLFSGLCNIKELPSDTLSKSNLAAMRAHYPDEMETLNRHYPPGIGSRKSFIDTGKWVGSSLQNHGYCIYISGGDGQPSILGPGESTDPIKVLYDNRMPSLRKTSINVTPFQYEMVGKNNDIRGKRIYSETYVSPVSMTNLQWTNTDKTFVEHNISDTCTKDSVFTTTAEAIDTKNCFKEANIFHQRVERIKRVCKRKKEFTHRRQHYEGKLSLVNIKDKIDRLNTEGKDTTALKEKKEQMERFIQINLETRISKRQETIDKIKLKQKKLIEKLERKKCI